MSRPVLEVDGVTARPAPGDAGLGLPRRLAEESGLGADHQAHLALSGVSEGWRLHHVQRHSLKRVFYFWRDIVNNRPRRQSIGVIFVS